MKPFNVKVVKAWTRRAREEVEASESLSAARSRDRPSEFPFLVQKVMNAVLLFWMGVVLGVDWSFFHWSTLPLVVPFVIICTLALAARLQGSMRDQTELDVLRFHPMADDQAFDLLVWRMRRRLWRILSPYIPGIVAFVLAQCFWARNVTADGFLVVVTAALCFGGGLILNWLAPRAPFQALTTWGWCSFLVFGYADRHLSPTITSAVQKWSAAHLGGVWCLSIGLFAAFVGVAAYAFGRLRRRFKIRTAIKPDADSRELEPVDGESSGLKTEILAIEVTALSAARIESIRAGEFLRPKSRGAKGRIERLTEYFLSSRERDLCEFLTVSNRRWTLHFIYGVLSLGLGTFLCYVVPSGLARTLAVIAVFLYGLGTMIASWWKGLSTTRFAPGAAIAYNNLFPVGLSETVRVITKVKAVRLLLAFPFLVIAVTCAFTASGVAIGQALPTAVSFWGVLVGVQPLFLLITLTSAADEQHNGCLSFIAFLVYAVLLVVPLCVFVFTAPSASWVTQMNAVASFGFVNFAGAALYLAAYRAPYINLIRFEARK